MVRTHILACTVSIYFYRFVFTILGDNFFRHREAQLERMLVVAVALDADDKALSGCDSVARVLFPVTAIHTCRATRTVVVHQEPILTVFCRLSVRPCYVRNSAVVG